jgi:hypothetical protein
VSTDSGNHGDMMRDGGGGADPRIGAGGEVICSMRFLALINNGGRRRPMAAMRPYSRCGSSIQQSANMLGNRLVLLNLESIIVNVS